MRADKYIKHYKDYTETIKQNQDLLEQMKALQISIGGLDYSKPRVTGSGYYNGASFEKTTDDIVTKLQAIQSQIDRQLQMLETAEQLIDSPLVGLTEAEKLVISWRYLNSRTIEETADIIGMSRRTVQYKTADAMKKLSQIEVKE